MWGRGHALVHFGRSCQRTICPTAFTHPLIHRSGAPIRSLIDLRRSAWKISNPGHIRTLSGSGGQARVDEKLSVTIIRDLESVLGAGAVSESVALRYRFHPLALGQA